MKRKTIPKNKTSMPHISLGLDELGLDLSWTRPAIQTPIAAISKATIIYDISAKNRDQWGLSSLSHLRKISFRRSSDNTLGNSIYPSTIHITLVLWVKQISRGSKMMPWVYKGYVWLSNDYHYSHVNIGIILWGFPNCSFRTNIWNNASEKLNLIINNQMGTSAHALQILRKFL